MRTFQPFSHYNAKKKLDTSTLMKAHYEALSSNEIKTVQLARLPAPEIHIFYSIQPF